jgi:Cell Wall Hydrolase
VNSYDRFVRPSQDASSLHHPEVESEFSISQVLSYVLCGISLVAAFAFAGHYMGQNAVARSLPELELRPVDTSPVSSISTKGSMLEMPFKLEVLPVSARHDEQMVQLATKGDFFIEETILPREDDTPRLASLPGTPPAWKLEESFKLKRELKNQVLAERKKRLAEQSCLATAVYYEARSESELGQLAVAKVILNRVRDPAYPKTICGVVYQGADKGHGCQFSFACDGRAEQPRSGRDWQEAKQIANRAMAGEADVKIVSTATHYHADYVQPRWAGTMKRLMKIGRHIFYRDS